MLHDVAGLLMVHGEPAPMMENVAEVEGDGLTCTVTVPVWRMETDTAVVEPGASPATTVSVV